MTQKEESISLGRDIDDWMPRIISGLKEHFEYIISADGELWFIYGEGAFHLVAFSDLFYGFVIEFSKGASEIDMALAIDIGQWPLLDYDTPNDMLQNMLAVLGK